MKLRAFRRTGRRTALGWCGETSSGREDVVRRVIVLTNVRRTRRILAFYLQG